MGRNHILLRLIVSGFGFFGVLLFVSKPVEAITINFSVTNNLSDINDLGLDITTNFGTIDLSSGGVGVSGGTGIDDFVVDNGESVTFSFIDSVANSVATFSGIFTSDENTTVVGTGTIEGFDADGLSLGIANINTLLLEINVSSLFNNVPLSAFTFTSDLGTGRRIGSISFDPVPVSTPEPSFLLGLSVLGFAGFKSLRRKNY